MLSSAFTLVRSASRIQARSFTRASPRSARGFIVFTARDQHEKGSNRSQQSNKPGGQDWGYYGRFPLKVTAVAGLSALTTLVIPDDSEEPQPNYAFKDPSGWGFMGTDESLCSDYFLRYDEAAGINSIEDARIAHFDFTWTLLDLCLHGEIIDEGPLPSVVTFGRGRFVKREHVKILWMPSPVQGRSSVLCLSVHQDLFEGEGASAFFDDAIMAGLGEYFLEKFKGEGEPYIHIEVHCPKNFFSILFAP